MRRESPAAYVFIAGVGYFFLAVLSLFVLPLLHPVHNTDAVKDVTNGQLVRVLPYSAEEAQGRRVYIREGCFYCHTQYVRPLADEVRRYGPVSQIGEYAHDVPHLFGTHRVGPDLSRVGGKVSDDWHYAHLLAPRTVVPGSIMPAYDWLFEGRDAAGRPRPTADGRALVAYLQKLGTDLGDWREQMPGTASASWSGQAAAGPLQEARAIYRQRCASCHGAAGDGQGPAAAMLATRPTDFTRAVFKFRSTPAGTLPTDGDLYRTITQGLPGTAMPPFHTLPERDRGYLVQLLKTFSNRWAAEGQAAPLVIPREARDSPESRERGQRLYAGPGACAACHGADPTAWARGHWKGGSGERDLYRGIATGLDGTAMPAYAGRLKPGEIWDIVHYLAALHRRPRLPAASDAVVSDPLLEVE